MYIPTYLPTHACLGNYVDLDICDCFVGRYHGFFGTIAFYSTPNDHQSIHCSGTTGQISWNL